MNVLVILPTSVNAAEAVQAWQRRLNHDDRLCVMSIVEPKETMVCGIYIHGLQVDDAKRGRTKPRLIRGLGWRLVSYGAGLWNAYLSEIWPEFLFNVQSFDPDIIDLRWVRGNDRLRNKLENGRWRVVSSESDLHQPYKTNTSWRSYDANQKVSVVLPVYNGQTYLRQSIESCLKQTHRNFELIIVDDCSTDNSPSIIAEYARQDSRVISIRNTTNKRLPMALNIGFASSTGELLTWTSDDNYYAPTALEVLVRHLCTWRDVDLVYSACRVVDESGRVEPKVTYQRPPWNLRINNVVGAYFLYRRRLYKEIGDYREDMEYVEDYDYWVRAYKRGFQIMRLHDPQYYYRVHAASMTSQILKADGPTYIDKARREHFEFGTS
jgi:glycosyl transferase family 2